MLLPALPIAFSIVAVTAASALAARRLDIPYSIVLVLVGAVLGFTPFMPKVELRPDLVLSLLLPPLLYQSGVGMSWRGFKANLGAILQLAVGLVIFTAAAVAWVSHALLGLPWAVGFVLGAIVSPPDAVAPMAIARRYAVPSRILTILEGEGLVNDATALILFAFAVGAVVSGGAFSLPAALGEFAAIVVGEIVWGTALGWASLSLRKWAADTRVEMVVSLLTPFAAFWVPEEFGGSGVLATVACGLFVSWNGPRFISPATRLQGFFVWDMVVYLVEGVIFLLTGLQAHSIFARHGDGDWGRLALEAGAVCLVVIAVRFVWVFAVAYVGRLVCLPGRRQPPPNWRAVFLIGFTGIRGVVSLAAVLSVPLYANGALFPMRDTLLLVTFAVILVTLVGQGLSFAWLVKKLGLVADGQREMDAAKRQEVAARVKSIDAALARLDALEGAASLPETVAALRRRHEDRRAYFVAACNDISEGQQALSSAALQLRFVEAERQSIAELYARGEIDDDARRRVERELDLEDSRLHHAAQSGVARTL